MSKKNQRTIKLTQKELDQLTEIRKRNEEVVPFDIEKIEIAIHRALEETQEGGQEEARFLAIRVFKDLLKLKKASSETFVPYVEMVQDLVEENLILENFTQTAKAFILYREKRAEARHLVRDVPEQTKQKVARSKQYFQSPYNEFIFYRTYSRWVPELGRRESWEEAIDRFMVFMEENLGENLTKREYSEVRNAILRQDVCPSMRLLWSAGAPCRESNVWSYNCSFIAPSKWQDLGEIMYILMCGAGLGFSVESENVQQFPQIQWQTGEKLDTHVVGDSKEGWADAFVHGISTWAEGKDVDFDYSQIRPAGARLKTAGGRASGPQPLKDLMRFTKEKILARQGRRLSNLDLHDIICQIGLIVVAGGVRRSALISLFDLDDAEMREAKTGQFWIENGQRSMANNSTVYKEKPDTETFLDQWVSLVKSKSGEPGIFNRGGLKHQMPKRRWEAVKDVVEPMGTNPCGEIVLQSKQFCNLTSIVVRPEDTEKDLKRKIKIATIIGTYQATLTKFPYLSKEWKERCEQERLLGVSFTGYYDNELIRDDKVLHSLRKKAVEVNKKYAEKFGINQSTSITTVKPHGNSGQLLHVGSGMHPWFAPYFIRRVRVSKNDPLYQLAVDQGVPEYPEVGYSKTSATTMVLEFPVKAPEGAVCSSDVSALDLLHEWKRIKENYVEHNPSVTIYVSDDEWIEVANFVYENWEIVGGLTFLPRTDHVYQLAPYEAISKEEYERRMKEIGDLDFAKLVLYEQEDNTIGSKEYACVSGTCTIDDALAEEAQENQQ